MADSLTVGVASFNSEQASGLIDIDEHETQLWPRMGKSTQTKYPKSFGYRCSITSTPTQPINSGSRRCGSGRDFDQSEATKGFGAIGYLDSVCGIVVASDRLIVAVVVSHVRILRDSRRARELSAWKRAKAILDDVATN